MSQNIRCFYIRTPHNGHIKKSVFFVPNIEWYEKVFVEIQMGPGWFGLWRTGRFPVLVLHWLQFGHLPDPIELAYQFVVRRFARFFIRRYLPEKRKERRQNSLRNRDEARLYQKSLIESPCPVVAGSRSQPIE